MPGQFAPCTISNLHLEILMMVFQHFIASLPAMTSSLNVNNGVWLLAHVCGTWFRLITSDPRLWTTITIVDDLLTSGIGPQGQTGLLNLILERSLGRPLTVSFQGLSSPQSIQAMQRLWMSRGRWESLEIVGLFSSPMNLWSLPQGARTPFSALRSLRLPHSNAEEEDIESGALRGVVLQTFIDRYTHNCAIFSRAPALETVQLQYFPALFHDGRVPLFPLKQLTDVDIEQVSVDEANYLLEKLESGKAVRTLRFSPEEGKAFRPSREYRLESLNKLTVEYSEDEVLHAIVAPLLQHLILAYLGSVRSLWAFVTGSRCSLIFLDIRDASSLDLTHLLTLFERLPYLKSLRLEEIGNTEAELGGFFQQLWKRDSQSLEFDLLPRLRCLRFRPHERVQGGQFHNVLIRLISHRRGVINAVRQQGTLFPGDNDQVVLDQIMEEDEEARLAGFVDYDRDFSSSRASGFQVWFAAAHLP